MSQIKDIVVDVNGKPLAFRNDKNFRIAGTKLSYTKEHITEYKRCSEDIVYFIENYCQVMDPDKGLSIPTLHDWQRDFIDLLKDPDVKKAIAKVSRQSGKSFCVALVLSWYSCFHNDRTSAIVANKEAVAKEIFKRVLNTVKYLPQFLKPGIVEYNKRSLEFDNGSRVIAGATSASALSGYTINGFCIIDECAKIPHGVFHDFYESMEPTIEAATDSKMVVISTPLGQNQFFHLWSGATDGNIAYQYVPGKKPKKGRNGFYPFSVSWNTTPKRDEAWKERKIKEVGQDTFDQEYCGLFTATSGGLLSSEVLTSIPVAPPLRKELSGDYKIYEEPIRDKQYLMTVDASEGVGKDYAVVNVFGFPLPGSGETQFHQVAMFRSNTVDATALAHIVAKIGTDYNMALAVLETNFGSETGTTLLNDLEYDNIYMADRRIGIKMDKRVKRIGIERMKEMLKTGLLQLHADEVVEELSNFVRRQSSYAAATGYTDDVVMTVVLFCYFTSLSYFSEFSDIDIYKDAVKKKIDGMIAEEEKNFITPIYMDNGSGGLDRLGEGSYGGSIFD